MMGQATNLLIDEETARRLVERAGDLEDARCAENRKASGVSMCCARVFDDGSAYMVWLHPNGEREYIVNPRGLPDGECAKPCDCEERNQITMGCD